MEKAYLVLVDGQSAAPDKVTHPLFSKVRLERIACHKTESMRLDCALAELAYLVAQKSAFGKIEKDLYYYADNNKPCFRDETLGFLSLAHAAHIGACLIAPVKCGCDAETLERDVGRIAGKISFWKCPEDKNALELWCAKESFVKLTGEGLARPFSRLLFENGIISDETGKRLAWAKTGEIGRVLWAVSLEKNMEMSVLQLSVREAFQALK